MTAKERNNFFYKYPKLAVFFVFFIILLATQSIVFQRYLINISESEKESTAELNRFVDQIQFNLNYALSATNTLAFIVENYGIPEEFDSIAKKLISANDLIDGIQLLENGIITKMYPLEGNEMVIGYNVVADPYRGKEVLLAAKKGQMYFGGPFELKQGGMGVVGRTPIKVDHDSLAFAAVVVKLEKLLEVGGIAENRDRFYYELSKINPDTHEVEYFLDNNFDINKSQVASFQIPMGEWQIYVKEKNGNHYTGLFPLSLMGLILGIIGAFFTKNILRRPAELERQVKMQTELIFSKDKRFRALVEKSTDAVAIIDLYGNPIYISPSVTSVLGYSESETYRRNLFNLIHPEDLPDVEKELKKVLNSPGVPIKGQLARNLHKDGSWRWIESTITNLIDDRDVRGIVVNFRDITEKKATERIQGFEQRNRDALINSTTDLIWSVSKDITLITANEAFKELFRKYTGISNVSKGDNMLPEQLDKDYISFWETLYNRALAGETFTYVNTVPENENHEEQVIETNFSPIVIEEKIEGVACSARNITDRVKTQEAIKEYNEKLRTAQEIAKLGYWELDFHTGALTWSDQVYNIWETDREKFTVSYDSFFGTIHLDDRDHFTKLNEKLMQGEEKVEIEHRIVLHSGKVKWVIERTNLIRNEKGEPATLEGTVQDITDQKSIELELREQNEFIKTALENLPIGIAVNRLDSGETTLMNRQFLRIYGWPQKELSDVETFFEKVYPDEGYRNEMKSMILSDIKSGNPKRMNWEGVKITTKKGQQRIVNAKNIPVYEQNLIISTVLDVTEKAVAESQLALSNERYEYVTKATFDAIWDWDLVKETIFWGEGFKTIFGHNVEKTSSDYWFQNIHPDDRNKVKSSIQVALQGNVLNWEDEYQFKNANGGYRYVKDRGIILRNVERKAIRFIGAMQDITPQKEYEIKLLDVNQKLRNLSAYLQEAREEERISIAREIHDELGQQLTGIKLDASWLKNKIIKHLPEDSERLERLIENINKAINDVRKVASSLRPGVLDDLGLEAAIEWQSQTFYEQTGIKTILQIQNISTKLGKDINTAIYRIYQETLTNILRHAQATEIKTLLLEKGNTLILEVEDNGIGIEETDKNNSLSLGITGMRERALMIQGTFSIEKQKKGGTKVKVLVPLFS